MSIDTRASSVARHARTARIGAVASAALLVAACGSTVGTGAPAQSAARTSTPSAAAVSTHRPSMLPSPTPAAPTAAPAPSGHLQLPVDFSVELDPGRYWSAPPFDLGFSFEVTDPGWVTGHLNPEFFDVQRFEGVPGEGWPSRLIGFAHPLTIQGATDIAVSDLTPAEAIAELEARENLEATNVTSLELFGRDAVRVDLHAPYDSTPVFGGDDGTFTLGNELDARLVAVPLDRDLLFALVMAPAGEIEAAWNEALPLLESVELR